MSSRILVSWLALLLGITAGVQAAPVVTIVEGDAILVRDSTRFALAEGMRLAPDDLIETNAQSKLLRIEFDDGLMMFVAPESRLWLEPKMRTDKGTAARAGRIYLMYGTIKLTAKADSPEIASPVATPLVDLESVGRDTVVSLGASKVAVFAESGNVRITERSRGKGGATIPGTTIGIRGGEYFSRNGTDRSSVSARPDPDFIQKLPRAFLDSLPSRAPLFAGRSVAPKPAGEMTYEDAKPWIDSEPALRPAFVARWKPLAAQPSFRQSLAADMKSHPEWDRILYPEKYLPKPPPPKPTYVPGPPLPAPSN